MARTTPAQLATAAITIKNKRDEIIDEVQASLKDKQDLYEEGVDSIAMMMRGEANEESQEDGVEDDLDVAADDSVDDSSDGDSPSESGSSDTGEDDGEVGDDDPDGDADFDDEDSDGLDDDFDEDDAEHDDEDEDPDEDDWEDDEEPVKNRKSKSKSRKDNPKRKSRKDIPKRTAGKTLLFHTIKIALLLAGTAGLALGAGPFAMIVGRGLMNIWDDMGDEIMGVANAAEADRRKVMVEVLNQTSDYMRFMDKADIEESSEIMYKAIATINPVMEPSADRNQAMDMMRASINRSVLRLFGDEEKDIEIETDYGGPVKLKDEDDEEDD